MLQLRLLNNIVLIGSTIMLLTLMTQTVNGKPQDSNVFEDIASKGLAMAGNMAEMLGDAGMISRQIGFDMPFSKVNSKTQIGTGAAFRNENDDDDSSEEDRRRRRKRALNLAEQEAPCHGGGGSGGGTGGTGGGTGTGGGGDEDVDVVERRRRAYARMMAARKKAQRKAKKTSRKTTKTRTKNKHLVNDGNDDDDDNKVDPLLVRRKRQTELDDLNQNMTDGMSKDFEQQAQQIAEKIRNVFQGVMNSMNEMAQRLKQHFSGQNSTNTEEI